MISMLHKRYTVYSISLVELLLICLSSYIHMPIVLYVPIYFKCCGNQELVLSPNMCQLMV